jgi:hypothetical protein
VSTPSQESIDLPSVPLVERLLPYELDRLVPYDPPLLADWAAALDRQDAEKVALGKNLPVHSSGD